MKTSSLLAPSLFALTALLSCSTGTESEEMIVQASPVFRVEVTQKSSNKITFLAKAGWPNGCGRFSHFESSQVGADYQIKVFGKQPREALCTQAGIQFDAPVDLTIGQPGTYTFRFWQSDFATLDTTIVFP